MAIFNLLKKMRYLIYIGILAGSAIGLLFYDFGPGIVLKLDREDLDPHGKPINPSTQSINRYASILRELDRLLTIDINHENKQINFELGSKNSDQKVLLKNIDIHNLVPLLPYPLTDKLDEFDLANLMLGEYARNGIELSYQDNNRLFGFFNASHGLFKTEKDYFVKAGMVEPNPLTRPLRFKVINNCLKPGLWEFIASDSVGEMYHSWFKMPKEVYFNMIRVANQIDAPNKVLAKALRYRKNLNNIPLKLEKLRIENKMLLTAKPFLAGSKVIGAYSSQDSRRKVQKDYFRVIRDGDPVQVKTFASLKEQDAFEVRRFVTPGVYSRSKYQTIPYHPYWTRVEIKSVTPLTRYSGSEIDSTHTQHFEITLYESGEKNAIVLGNIPVNLLVAQEDFQIPAFGVGILLPSEPIERRYLRIKQGPVPHYAYQIEKDEHNRWVLVNNHETGIEQVYLRPFERQGQLYLRVTLVSYERIVDLMELEVPLQGPLVEQIRTATEQYQPPLFRVYEDTNII